MAQGIKKYNFDKFFGGRYEPIPEAGCYIWMGAEEGNGYGAVRYHGNKWRTHRLAWTLVHKKIPEDKLVLHRCDTPQCINPHHLFLGTQKDNVQDMISKNRQIPIGKYGVRQFISGKRNPEYGRRYRFAHKIGLT